ncbi:hypothetical protein, partial [Chelativorans composti]|uniref:hypothetical protein n=1 Tax=Chelativorans composti TaxID=768533 RepID=UPI0031F116F6
HAPAIGKRARHGAGHCHLAWFCAAAWPDFAPPLTLCRGSVSQTEASNVHRLSHSINLSKFKLHAVDSLLL